VFKLGLLEEGGKELAYSYPDIWSVERTKGPDRIIIAPARGQVDLLLGLTSSWIGLRIALYVLLVSRCDNQLGRYESPPLTEKELLIFMRTYKSFLESDARHHLWVGLVGSNSLLVHFPA